MAVALLGGVASCKKSSPSRAEQAVGMLVQFRDRACACADVKCVRLAQKELADWLLANGAELSGLKFTKAQDEAGDKASKEMAKCVEAMDQAAAKSAAPE